ncbi:hypothetical protein BDP27DRAFT_1329470 [Rhodocollybia butyracea]|uniref:F-box domain-containing protein n=1 Tax=Rhodocollybia butyracea TaxID=206335 RepID=A0A9P5U6P6_9AGAR|nr:hypothetical protein BDP27DRAFT_1329470 [Rhodocollybia butyracea]
MELRVSSIENVQIFRSGYVPSSSEYTRLSKIIKEAEGDMACYNRELNRLERISSMIRRKKKVLETYIRDVRCATAPIRIVPPEILGEIFEYSCCGDTRANQISTHEEEYEEAEVEAGVKGKKHENKRGIFLAAVSLSHVCSRWRRVVTSMPSLWSCINLGMERYTVGAPSLLRLYLRTSKLHPLHLTVTQRTALYVRLLVQNSDRWRSIRLFMPHRHVANAVFVALHKKKHTLPELVSLQIGYDPNFQLNKESTLPVESCPSLRSITLHSFNLNLLCPRPSILTLNLTALSASRIYHLIENSPNVQEIYLRRCFCMPIGSRDNVVPKATSNVQRLTVDYDGGTHIVETALFENLFFPRLACLTLLDSFKTPPYNAEPIIFMLQSSSTSLTRLSIKITLEDDQLLRILHCVPNVTHLQLSEQGNVPMVTEKVLHEMTISESPVVPSNYRTEGPELSVGAGTTDETSVDAGANEQNNEPPLLPYLTDLALDVCPVFTNDILMKFLHSRLNLGKVVSLQGAAKDREVASLKKFNLKRAVGARFDQLRTQLEELGTKGLDVSF